MADPKRCSVQTPSDLVLATRTSFVPAGAMRVSARPARAALRFAAAAALGFVMHGTAASAAPGDLAEGDFTINDENPTASIPTPAQREKQPLEFGYWLQDMILRGETAVRGKRWADAVKYYEALARAVPDRAVSFSRLCLVYGELDKLDIAAGNCGKAITLGGATVIDHFRFVNFMLAKKQLSAGEVADIDASIAHLLGHAPHAKPSASVSAAASAAAAVDSDAERVKRKFFELRARQAEAEKKAALARTGTQVGASQAPSPDDEANAKLELNLPLEIAMLSCKVAARLEDAKRLDACVAGLKLVNAPEALTLPYQWSKAVVVKDAAGATQLLDHAKSIGFPEASIATMREEQSKLLAPKGLVGHLKRWAVVWLAAVLAVAFVTFRYSSLSKQRKPPPAPAA